MKTRIEGAAAGADVTVHTVPAYGFAAALAEVSPVTRVETDISREELARIRLRLPEAHWEAPATDPQTPPPASASPLLEAMTAPAVAHVIVERDGREIGRAPVMILPPRDWSHAEDSRVLVAAHVAAGDDDVFRLTLDAGGGEALWAVAREGAEDAALRVLRCLYDHVAASAAVYQEPERSTDDRTRASWQTVRAPHDVLDAAHRSAKGTCLDLTLVLAGALECLGLPPLVVFTGSPDRAPRHACLGLWADGGRRFHPVVTDVEQLRKRVASGELIVVETTGLCGGSRALGFDEARDAAGRLVRETPDVHAVDVLAARPPHGDVRPVRLAHDPTVRAAFWAGESLRRRLHARSRETLHLLYGLCATRGSLTHRLFERCGVEEDAILRILDSSLPNEGHEGPSSETQSYRVALETARLNARGRGAAAVEEGDVLWAVLDSPSRNVRRVVEASGSDCTVLLAALAREWRRSRDATISRHFDAVPPGSPRSGG
ncbi:MAG TPA: hypothetical protein VKU85_10960 [bacterium]|nr:hypothetical protein [bacterium]